jgi:hypothetical protein
MFGSSWTAGNSGNGIPFPEGNGGDWANATMDALAVAARANAAASITRGAWRDASNDVNMLGRMKLPLFINRVNCVLCDALAKRFEQPI